MSVQDTNYIIGINWGSTNFRAYRIDEDGTVSATIEQPRGIAGLERSQMTPGRVVPSLCHLTKR